MKYNLKNSFKKKLAEEKFKKFLDKGALIELKEIRQRRTIDQNSLYWLWLTCLEKEADIGYKKEELHLLFRAKFLRIDEEKVLKIIYPKVYYRIIELVETFQYFEELNQIIDLISKSTTEIDTKEFTYYLDSIKDFSALNFNVELLTLDDINFNEFYKEYY